MVLVDSVVVRLQVEIAELVRHEEVPVHVDEGAGLVALELARDAPTLSHGHYLMAVFTIEDGMVGYLESPLGGAVTEQLLLDPCSVEIAEEFVSSILEFFELSVRNTIGDVGNDL